MRQYQYDMRIFPSFLLYRDYFIQRKTLSNSEDAEVAFRVGALILYTYIITIYYAAEN